MWSLSAFVYLKLLNLAHSKWYTMCIISTIITTFFSFFNDFRLGEF